MHHTARQHGPASGLRAARRDPCAGSLGDNGGAADSRTSAGKTVGAGEFQRSGEFNCVSLAANEGAARAAERRQGIALTGEFHDAATGIKVVWRAVVRNSTNYLREEVEFGTDSGSDLASITLVDFKLERPRVAGTVQGSPLIAGDNFYGFEHPMSEVRVEGGRATAWLKRALPLRSGVREKYAAVFGVAPHDQLRRGFEAYLENERAAPFRTFLHYNSWYDIGYFTPYTEEEAIAVVNAFGQKLVKERSVVMDSFLFDDGWDDLDRLWQFNSDFPYGFAPVRAAAEKFGAEPGVWLSPWGGYGKRRTQRLAAAKAGGYELDDQGLALSGMKYYPLFHDAAVTLLKTYGINQFKFDGTGSPDKVTPGSEFDSHWIGGDPAQLQVYGWASWSPDRAIIALRNPSDQRQTYSLDLARALELPEGTPSTWNAVPAFGLRKGRVVRARVPIRIKLKPFEVLVWDLVPVESRFQART